MTPDWCFRRRGAGPAARSARTIAIVDTSRRDRPRLLRRARPGFAVHDLAFDPGRRRVWLTSDDDSSVHVVNAATGRLVFRVPAGPPPQHVAFDLEAPRAWVTSGYGRRVGASLTAAARGARPTGCPG